MEASGWNIVLQVLDAFNWFADLFLVFSYSYNHGPNLA